LAPPAVPPGLSALTFAALAGVQGVLVAPFLAIVLGFGEEYGWRGYLQSELLKLGRVRGVTLVGVIWGAWHWPIILMGFNYPGHPLLGVVLMTLYTTGLAVVLGYAVLRSGSVLLVAYLHALNDQVVNYLVAMGCRPFDAAFSFGIGVYGLVTLALVAALILRDPLWQDKHARPRPDGRVEADVARLIPTVS
ncbi:MAG: CPBP family intramembrane metalloprotease, partial [Chloroflexi bacterium]|nr:CPBP family intramembrane metalloprotease [Chloroflexota bacterium]